MTLFANYDAERDKKLKQNSEYYHLLYITDGIIVIIKMFKSL